MSSVDYDALRDEWDATNSNWAETDRIKPSGSICPDCGADSSNIGDRQITTCLEPVVDGELRVRVAARCPCGWSDEWFVGGDDRD